MEGAAGTIGAVAASTMLLADSQRKKIADRYGHERGGQPVKRADTAGELNQGRESPGEYKRERGVFCSLDELTTALEEWIKLWNEGARPFKWTKTADQIIDRICRYCSRISEPAH
jgi:hypothetical protein